jgi:hypothetical protein
MYKSDKRLRKLYARYNKEFFDSELPVEVQVGWNDDPATSYGFTLCIDDDETDHVAFQIHLNKAIQVSYEQTRLTLLHEMAHVKLHPYTKHGKKFQEEMKRLAGRDAFEGLW